MTDKEYWTKRAIQYNEKGDKTANKVISNIKELYKKFIKDVEKETLAFYGKYAEKTGKIYPTKEEAEKQGIAIKISQKKKKK